MRSTVLLRLTCETPEVCQQIAADIEPVVTGLVVFTTILAVALQVLSLRWPDE